jgi:cob(I)alamin adenosyltransferase
MVTLLSIEPNGVSTAAMQWINRCSDLLFAMARAANRFAGVPDVPWRGS